ncbi:MAG: NAD(P)-dependent oxidoreductase [Candidatus Acidiferrales bacterium]|jgi:3-hydroxyisobutyrate dehydrogenase-like beta-hydroxyacid dehydrogenase
MDIGFIGLGRMGQGMAQSLLRAGHRVTVYNRTRERAEALRSAGALVAESVAGACRAGIVQTMVADDAALESFVFGPNAILASLPQGGVHISSSTISVALSQRLAAEHAKAGQVFLSAPVFGRPEVAEAGRLLVVAAGPAGAIEKCKPLLDAVGTRTAVVGTRPELANVVKLTGNFLIANVLESLAEALAFARKSGVDAAQLVEILTSTLFDAPVYKNYGNLILKGNDDTVGFSLPLGFKDIRLVLAAAEARNVPMPIASLVHDRMLAAMARGYGDRDWSVLGRVAAEDAGLPSS